MNNEVFAAEFEVKFAKYKRDLKINENVIRKAINSPQSTLRHGATNYDEVEKEINAKEHAEMANKLVHCIQNKVNNKIDAIKTEYIKSLFAAVESYEVRAKEAEDALKASEAEVAALRRELLVRKANEESLCEKHRDEVAALIVTKEQYKQFLAEMLECTLAEVSELV